MVLYYFVLVKSCGKHSTYCNLQLLSFRVYFALFILSYHIIALLENVAYLCLSPSRRRYDRTLHQLLTGLVPF